jgi:uncharacterized protein (DUF302 family)
MTHLDAGIERVRSSRNFADTLAHLEASLPAKGLTIFAKIDFAADARRAGLDMPPTVLFAFGNPKAGTPVMLAYPRVALDLPLKFLISEDEDGSVWISFNKPEYIAARHGLSEALAANLAGIRALAKALAA